MMDNSILISVNAWHFGFASDLLNVPKRTRNKIATVTNKTFLKINIVFPRKRLAFSLPARDIAYLFGWLIKEMRAELLQGTHPKYHNKRYEQIFDVSFCYPLWQLLP